MIIPTAPYTVSTTILTDNVSYVGIASGTGLSRALQCNPASDRWVQFFVPKILDIPVQKPDSEGIVTVNSCVEIISQRVVNTPVVTGYTNSDGVFVPGEDIPNAECTHLTGKKLIVEGVIHQKVIYTALVAEQSLHSADFTIPLSTFIIVGANEPLTQDFIITPIWKMYLPVGCQNGFFSVTTQYL